MLMMVAANEGMSGEPINSLNGKHISQSCWSRRVTVEEEQQLLLTRDAYSFQQEDAFKTFSSWDPTVDYKHFIFTLK